MKKILETLKRKWAEYHIGIIAITIIVILNNDCFSQVGEVNNPSKLSVSLGLQYSIPFMDITLDRGTRKTVTHEISPSIGLISCLRYHFRTKTFLLIALEYDSYNYKSTETFFNGMSFPAADKLLNININAGIGWIFPIKDNKLLIQTYLVYVIHNKEFKNFFSERVLPDDLETINITTIDWNLINSPGLGLSIGYNVKIGKKMIIEFFDSVLFSIIEADIVDSPTSNDFDNEPNMSRTYWVNNLGGSYRFSF